MRRSSLFVAALLALLAVFLLPTSARAQMSWDAFVAANAVYSPAAADTSARYDVRPALKARVGVTRLERIPSASAPAAPQSLTLHLDRPDDDVLVVSRACGTVCAVQRAERRLRDFSDANRAWLAPVLGSAAAITQGWLHGSFYSRAPNGSSFYDVHGASYVHASLVWGLTYVAGADPVDAYGAAIISNFFFQGLLNVGAGLPFIDRTEVGCWDTWGGVCVPKIMAGGARYGQLVVGAAFIAGPRLVRWMRRR